MKYLAILLGSSLLLCPLSAQAKTITLKDGSTINGNVVGMNNGNYLIQTAAMGNVEISDQNVASISDTAAPIAATAAASNNQTITALPEFQQMQQKIMNNPAFLTDIQKLMEDPEILAIMTDPSFIEAVQTGNTSNLQNDPRVKRLSDNPKMQALMHRIKSGQ